MNERHHNFWMKFSISDHSGIDYREIINSYCPHTLCALLSGKSVRTPQLLQWKTFFGVTAYITKKLFNRGHSPRVAVSRIAITAEPAVYKGAVETWSYPKL